VDTKALKAALTTLAEAIDSVNPRAIKAAVKDIQPFSKATGISDAVENILQKTLTGEYEETLPLIKTLLKGI
jgi:predicted transcriptional regulator